jgi:phospholipase D-like protein
LLVVDWLSRGYFTECLKAGMRVFGYNTKLHAKTCTIDSEWSTSGTANPDRLSSVGNYEINVEVYSKKLAQQLEELSKCDTSNSLDSAQESIDRPNIQLWFLDMRKVRAILEKNPLRTDDTFMQYFINQWCGFIKSTRKDKCRNVYLG